MNIVKPVMDIDNIELESACYVADKEFFTKYCVHPVGELYGMIKSNGKCGDLLSGCSSNKIVSRRAWDLISSFEMTPNIQSNPINIKSRHAKTEYFLISCGNDINILDLDGAEVGMVNDKVAWIDKWVIDGKKLPDSDVVFSRNAWFFTDRLVDAIRAAELTGFEFTPVEVT